MGETLRIASKYLHYYITAQNGKGHGIHSPFVFDFVINVLNDKRHFHAYTKVEALRKKLLEDGREIEVEDMGAGSTVSTLKRRQIADIAKHAAKPKKFGQLLFRMVNYYQPSNIIELGTSLGITTSYLASADTRIPVITMEGAAAVVKEAVKNFDEAGLGNIRVIEGNFDNTLPRILSVIDKPDFVFIDGNHRMEPTCNYFHQLAEKIQPSSILIFDDIHWSKEMERAWEMIKAHSAVRLSIDLFFIGIVFFRPEFKEKQHFVIRF